jgi:hypothetical protein
MADPTLDAIHDALAQVKVIAAGRHISNPVRLIVTPMLPTPDGLHWWHDPLSSVLFVSREAKAAIVAHAVSMESDIERRLYPTPSTES